MAFVLCFGFNQLEDDRFKNFLELVNRVRDSEEEKMAYSGIGQQMQEKVAAQGALTAAGGLNGGEKRIQEFVNFKIPKDLALVSLNFYQQSLLKQAHRFSLRKKFQKTVASHDV